MPYRVKGALADGPSDPERAGSSASYSLFHVRQIAQTRHRRERRRRAAFVRRDLELFQIPRHGLGH
jgi:hypothetical protein